MALAKVPRLKIETWGTRRNRPQQERAADAHRPQCLADDAFAQSHEVGFDVGNSGMWGQNEPRFIRHVPLPLS